jgi:hypothetical protein
MKSLAKTLLCALAGLVVSGVTNAWALQITMGTFTPGAGGNYRFDPGSGFPDLPYAAGAADGTWYGTFCLEHDEYFTPGGTYNVEISNRAWNGGINTDNGDVISVGTAFLYEQFATGALSGFTYGSSTSAAKLQDMIWYLEGEISLTDLGVNPFASLLSTQFGSVAAAQVDYSGSAVRVMNLTSNSGQILNQDQLIYVGVPDGGFAVTLMGIAILSIVGFRSILPQTANVQLTSL